MINCGSDPKGGPPGVGPKLHDKFGHRLWTGVVYTLLFLRERVLPTHFFMSIIQKIRELHSCIGRHSRRFSARNAQWVVSEGNRTIMKEFNEEVVWYPPWTERYLLRLAMVYTS